MESRRLRKCSFHVGWDQRTHIPDMWDWKLMSFSLRIVGFLVGV